MQIESRARLKINRSGTKAQIILDMMLMPRGSGNRAFARRLGESFKRDKRLDAYRTRVVIGASRVTVHLKAEPGLMATILEISQSISQQRDLPGQLPMFV
jgi:hypothetical protein